MVLLLFFLFLALGFSFLCSMLEAVLLSVPRSHVRVLQERGSWAGQRLQRMKDDIDRPLAAILTLNTFAHTLGAAGVGAQATVLWGEAWVGAVSVVVTLLILVFSEIIPKTLGAVHCKGLAPFAAWTTHGLILVFGPVVWVCNATSKIVSGGLQSAPALSRDEVRVVADMALEGGAIDETEAAVLRNLIALRETTVEKVMTPRPVVAILPADQTVGESVSNAALRFSRIPVVGASLDEPLGLVRRHEILTAHSEGRTGATLREFASSLHVVPELATLPDVLKEFLRRREHLFLVVDEYGDSVGIVTLEDVLETLLGVEIVDETDTVADMQELAKRLLKRRES